MRFYKISIMLLLCDNVGAALADDDGAVLPYRPSVSSPAQLPQEGQLEFELGGLASKSGDTRRDSLPYLFKLAFNPQWGLLFGGEAYVSSREDGGSRARGLGDSSLVLKRAFLVDDATAFGLEFGAKLPTAKDSIGSGSADYSINNIFSKDMGKLHMDLNLNVTKLGGVDAGTSSLQTGLSSSFSLPIAEQWGTNFEWSGTRRNGAASTAQLLGAFTYSPSKRMTIDFGVVRGLNSASPDWSLFTGIVVPVAKLW
ncbi:transporter [Undibacterium sp. TJN25]|uniref:transporter n=1 Tax=Undibacterium sp. TJN25 TaxID=3413056 RepID=UPI003BF353FF